VKTAIVWWTLQACTRSLVKISDGRTACTFHPTYAGSRFCQTESDFWSEHTTAKLTFVNGCSRTGFDARQHHVCLYFLLSIMFQFLFSSVLTLTVSESLIPSVPTALLIPSIPDSSFIPVSPFPIYFFPTSSALTFALSYVVSSAGNKMTRVAARRKWRQCSGRIDWRPPGSRAMHHNRSIRRSVAGRPTEYSGVPVIPQNAPRCLVNCITRRSISKITKACYLHPSRSQTNKFNTLTSCLLPSISILS